MIIRGENLTSEEVKESKKVVDAVLNNIIGITEGVENVTLDDVLSSCDVSLEQYENAMDTMQRQTTILYKRQINELNIVPYNPVILSLLKSNMNIQFVTGVYGLLSYLTAYLCKPEKKMSELMKKATKEAYREDIRGKLKAIGNVFLKNREVSLLHEAIKRLLSGPFRRSNIATQYIPTGPQKDRIRMLKPRKVLDEMDPSDTNIFATDMIVKYANRFDLLEDMCFADFATNYVHAKAD